MGANPVKSMELPGDRTFSVVLDNLLTEETDCIVNAANGRLAHGGGVAAAILRAAGPDLEAEGDQIVRERGTIPIGEAVVTTAGNLPFKGVIHTVGPQLGVGDEEAKLIAAVKATFLRATERGWESLSFPAISSGIFAVPLEICARAYVHAARQFFESHPDSSLHTIRLCLFEGPMVEEVLEHMDVD